MALMAGLFTERDLLASAPGCEVRWIALLRCPRTSKSAQHSRTCKELRMKLRRATQSAGRAAGNKAGKSLPAARFNQSNLARDPCRQRQQLKRDMWHHQAAHVIHSFESSVRCGEPADRAVAGSPSGTTNARLEGFNEARNGRKSHENSTAPHATTRSPSPACSPGLRLCPGPRAGPQRSSQLQLTGGHMHRALLHRAGTPPTSRSSS